MSNILYKNSDGDAKELKATGAGTTGDPHVPVHDVGTVTTVTNVVHVDDNASTLSVDDGGASLTVDGTVAATQSGTWNVGTVTTVTNVVHVDDNASTLSVDDGGSSLTVDGTVAATQSGTWNVGTVTTLTGVTNVVHVDDNSSTLSVDDGGSSLTVDGTVAATQSGTWNVGTVSTVTNVVHVDDNSSSLTVDGTVTVTQSTASSLKAQVTILDGAGDSCMDNTNDALRVNVVAGGTSGTQYTEDAAAASDPVGNAIIVVRDDSRSGSITSADGDNVALRGTNKGELYVKQTDNVNIGTYASVTWSTAQVSVTDSATLLAASDSLRKSVTIVNHSTTDVFIGNGSVTTSNGVLLVGVKGASLTLEHQDNIYAIVATGSVTVSLVVETDYVV